ncbi:MAG: hypothetical protein E7646_06605 [Ruminococcaceae bacterium]|nr:hypothetical protein [Oscillospiraceae bacterium]
MKKITVLLTALMLLFTCACSQGPDLESVSGGYIQAGEKKLTPEYVMEIDGKKIGFDQYRYFFLNVADSMAYMQNAQGFWTEEKISELKAQVEDYLLKAHALEKYAEKNSLTLTEDEKNTVTSYVDDIMNNMGKEEFKENMNTLYLTEKLYRSLQADEAVYEKIYTKLFGEGGEMAWSDEEFNSYYAENYICATHVLISFSAGETPENCPLTYKKAQDVLALTSTEDFDTLIEKYGTDKELENYPTGYYFTEGDMVKEFYEAAKALKVGEISPVVVTTAGCHVIKRLEPDKEQIALQKDAILNGSSSGDGSFKLGVYAELFEDFYTELTEQYKDKISYNPEVEAYLKPGSVF